jgi:hypothetical protein
MSKTKQNTSSHRPKKKISRPGVHSKKQSKLKTSKMYKKKYVGQG